MSASATNHLNSNSVHNRDIGRATRPRLVAHTNGQSRPRKKNRRTAARRAGVLLLPAYHSVSTKEALLRTGAELRADRLQVAYHGPDVQFELRAFGQTLFSGDWQSDVTIDDCRYTPRGCWECLLWNCDADGDYLELQLKVDDTLRIDRQFLLSRTGHFAVLADSVIACAADRVSTTVRLPVASGVQTATDRETREQRLRTDSVSARVIPLGLPRERTISTPGSCQLDSKTFQLSQAAPGRALFAPVVIDWHPRRRQWTAQWRRLTVSEQGAALRLDQAAAHRMQMGQHQLLVYHSLVNSYEPRAVLGYHTWHETVIGLVRRTGDIEPIIEVETEAPNSSVRLPSRN